MSLADLRGRFLALVWVLGAGGLVALTASPGQSDYVVDAGPPVQNEISLAVVPGTLPGQPQVLLAAYNDDPYPPSLPSLGLGVSYSTNYGVNWTSAQLPYPVPSGAVPPPPIAPIPAGTQFNWSFDPTATVDTNGNMFVAHIAVDGAIGNSNGLYVWKSTGPGQPWNQTTVSEAGPAVGPSDPSYRFNDRCQITTDRFAGSPNKDNVYIAWIKDRGFNVGVNSDIYFAWSNNGGATFNELPAPLNNTLTQPLGNMPVPRVAADGHVFVSWLDYNVQTGGTGTIYLTESTNGGASFAQVGTGVSINLPPLRLNGGSDALAKGAPVLATSPTNANELYIVYAGLDVANPLDEADIYFIKSTNGGASWGPPIQVNTDLPTDTQDQILPWIDVKPNGTIDVAWYDRRNDPSDLLWDVYVATSTDGGASFSSEFQLNALSFATPTTPSGAWMGEYLGVAVDSGFGYVAWSSSAVDSAGDIYFDSFANAPQEIIPEPSALILLLAAAASLAAFGSRRRRR